MQNINGLLGGKDFTLVRELKGIQRNRKPVKDEERD